MWGSFHIRELRDASSLDTHTQRSLSQHVLIVNDNGAYGNTRVSKDVIFDESVVFDKFIDNSPTDEEFAALPHIIENMNNNKRLHSRPTVLGLYTCMLHMT